MRTREVMMKRAWRERGFLLLQSNDENERTSEWMNEMAEWCGDEWIDARIPEHVTFSFFLKNETIATAA
jgi:hypothetical protein